MLIICLHTLKWFQVLLSNTNSFICTQLNGFKYCYLTLIIQSNNSSIDGNLTGITTLGERETVSNVNERILHIPKTLRLEPHHQMQFNAISRKLNSFKYCYLTLIILFYIIHLLAHS